MVARAIVATKIMSHISVSVVEGEKPSFHFFKAYLPRVRVRECHGARGSSCAGCVAYYSRHHVALWTPRIPASWNCPIRCADERRALTPAMLSTPSTLVRLLAFFIPISLRRWSLAYDGIEPLRPPIERRVFDFIRKHQFGPNDFIQTNDGTIRINDNLLRVVIAETALGGRTTDAAVNWIVGLLRCEPNLSNPISLPPAFLPGL